jgi:hypothetical protein
VVPLSQKFEVTQLLQGQQLVDGQVLVAADFVPQSNREARSNALRQNLKVDFNYIISHSTVMA